MNLWDTLWHKRLNRPYHLHKAFDQGSGEPVVLLHGLGRSAEVWQELVRMLDDRPAPSGRVLGYDLLGFGASPKPEWPRYDSDDHARAVIASLERARLGRPAILVGHSMGCLISVRVARLRPDLVRHLILYEMPLYAGLPDKRRYRMRLNLYFNVYERIITYRPIFKGPGKGRAQRLAERLMGYRLSDETWKPFIRSLKHTIMQQTAHQDIKQLAMPMDVIYGTRDRVVIRGKTTEIFGSDVTNITAHNIRENHSISQKASRFILGRIDAVFAAPDSRTTGVACP